MSLVKGKGLENIDSKQLEAQGIANEFIQYLNEFHSKGIQNDNKILVQLYKDYIAQIEYNLAQPFSYTKFFSPSATNSCARELYMKMSGAKPDTRKQLAQTTRWQNLGTRIGDMIQFDLLLAEKHTKPNPFGRTKFAFERIMKDLGTPFMRELPHFEEFSTKGVHFNHNGQNFLLQGSTDGIMEYTNADGKTIRVGLEVKSKQTSYARTSLHSMKEVDFKHKKQTVSYSLLFDVDYWIVLYVNASKKSWSPTAEDIVKTPDIRAFGHYVTEGMKKEVLDRFAMICECVDKKTPPMLEVDKWTFNNWKKACAESMTNDDLYAVLDFIDTCGHYPQWLVNQMTAAVDDIVERGKFNVQAIEVR